MSSTLIHASQRNEWCDSMIHGIAERQLMNDELLSAVKWGGVGTTSTFGAVMVTGLDQMEQWLRILTLIIGLLIGVASLVSMILTIRRKLKKPSDDTSQLFKVLCVTTFIGLTMGCGSLIPTERQQSQSVKSTEALATDQERTIRRILEVTPGIPLGAESVITRSAGALASESTPTRSATGKSAGANPAASTVAQVPVQIREDLYYDSRSKTGAGSQASAAGNLSVSIPLGVKLALIGVGIAAIAGAIWGAWRLAKNTAIGQAVALVDSTIAQKIRTKREAATLAKDPDTIAKLQAEIAEAEAERGRLRGTKL